MRAVVQRVKRASVTVDGTVVGRIGTGLLVLLGVAGDDDASVAGWMAEKVRKLRIFEDASGKMNLSVEEIGGGILAVSQFTLYGDVARGNRPGFERAAAPGPAEALYDAFVALLEAALPGRVGRGVFRAAMEVELVNDGPVTILLERSKDG